MTANIVGGEGPQPDIVIVSCHTDWYVCNYGQQPETWSPISIPVGGTAMFPVNVAPESWENRAGVGAGISLLTARGNTFDISVP